MIITDSLNCLIKDSSHIGKNNLIINNTKQKFKKKIKHNYLKNSKRCGAKKFSKTDTAPGDTKFWREIMTVVPSASLNSERVLSAFATWRVPVRRYSEYLVMAAVSPMNGS